VDARFDARLRTGRTTTNASDETRKRWSSPMMYVAAIQHANATAA
jgi:hypothetical protein